MPSKPLVTKESGLPGEVLDNNDKFELNKVHQKVEEVCVCVEFSQLVSCNVG